MFRLDDTNFVGTMKLRMLIIEKKPTNTYSCPTTELFYYAKRKINRVLRRGSANAFVIRKHFQVITFMYKLPNAYV